MKYSLGTAMLLLVLSGCYKEPNYPKEPRIEYAGATHKLSSDVLGNPIDSLTIKLRFEDGDGDLGLPKDDPRFAGPEYQYNYYATLYVKNKGKYELFPLPNPALNFNGRFPLLAPEEQVGPIEGELRRTIPMDRNTVTFDTIKFHLQIQDRALNKSNVIESGEIVLLK